MRIELPNQWAPRPHQVAAWNYIMGGGKRASLWWHRRAGKDDFALNVTAVMAHQRVGTYWHMCPEKEQVRKAVWDSFNHRGQKRIDQAFPPEIRKRTVENAMTIELLNGSMIHFLGSDRYDANVGTNPIGIVFSEWALCDPKAWAYLSPILAARENDGWGLFITTPRGVNHAYDMHEMAKEQERWFAETLTVEDTCDEEGRPIISLETIEQERREGKPDHEIRQEYYCEALSDTDYQMIPMSAIASACSNPAPANDPRAPTIMGYDVGLSGDPSVRVIRTGWDMKTVPPRYCKDMDFDQQADLICEDIERFKPDQVFIDETGIGYGLVTIVKGRGYPCHGINFGAKASNPDRFLNKRAEMYHRLSEWMQDCHASVYDTHQLRRQLSAVRYDPSSAKIKVLGKAEIKKQLGCSTDEADACALTFARLVPDRQMRASRFNRQQFAIM